MNIIFLSKIINFYNQELALDSDTRKQLSQVATIVKLVNIIPILMVSCGAGLIFLTSLIIVRRHFTLKSAKVKESYINFVF